MNHSGTKVRCGRTLKNFYMKNLFLFILLLNCFTFTNTGFSQPECGIKVSLITCAPGNELYSTFGHTALRITDSAAGVDNIFNWGTFDFGDPDFYTKFVRGNLDYFLSVEKPDQFLQSYYYEERPIIEQELNLNCKEKIQLYNAVKNNLQGSNKYYRYDFLKDNCTSRVRDLLLTYTPFTVHPNIVNNHTTYRNLIHEYLNAGGKAWEKFGIDLLLGSGMDQKANDLTAMFLPDYLLKGADSSVNFVSKKETILPVTAHYQKTPLWLPFLILSALAVVLMAMGFVKNPVVVTISKLLDSLLFYLVGLLGLFLLFMWFGTSHTLCANNYNLLWALPTHFFAAIFVWRPNRFVQKYFLLASFLHVATIIAWLWIPQELNIALLPVVALLAIKTFRLSAEKRNK